MIILFTLLIKLTYVYHDNVFIISNYLFFLLSLFLGMFIFYSFEFIIASLVFWFSVYQIKIESKNYNPNLEAV